MENKKGDSKMSIITQPKFDTNPKEGSYKRLSWCLVEGFLNNTLPDYIYYDLALSTSELMQPMRQYVSNYLSIDHIKAHVDDKHIGKSILALRLIPFCSDDKECYNKLRKMFLDIKLPDENEWLHQKKKCLAGVLPYFTQYDSDDSIKSEIFDYYEYTPHEQIETVLRYFGGIDKFSDGFINALKDGKGRKSKHWVYMWCFKAICKKGLLNETVKNGLKEVIKEYKCNQTIPISKFEEKVIDDALKC